MIIALLLIFGSFFLICCFAILTRNNMDFDSEGFGLIGILGMIVSLILLFGFIFTGM